MIVRWHCPTKNCPTTWISIECSDYAVSCGSCTGTHGRGYVMMIPEPATYDCSGYQLVLEDQL